MLGNLSPTLSTLFETDLSLNPKFTDWQATLANELSLSLPSLPSTRAAVCYLDWQCIRILGIRTQVLPLAWRTSCDSWVFHLVGPSVELKAVRLDGKHLAAQPST